MYSKIMHVKPETHRPGELCLVTGLMCERDTHKLF